MKQNIETENDKIQVNNDTNTEEYDHDIGNIAK